MRDNSTIPQIEIEEIQVEEVAAPAEDATLVIGPEVEDLLATADAVLDHFGWDQDSKQRLARHLQGILDAEGSIVVGLVGHNSVACGSRGREGLNPCDRWPAPPPPPPSEPVIEKPHKCAVYLACDTCGRPVRVSLEKLPHDS